MREVSKAPKPADKVKSLLDIKGIGIPIASAILAVCYPKLFTVLDSRALKSLRSFAVDGLPAHYPGDAKRYLKYCEASASSIMICIVS